MPSRWERFFLFAVVLALLHLTLPPAKAQDARAFKDWVVVCETATTCTAVTTANGRTDTLSYTFNLMLRRAANEANPVKVLLTFTNAEPQSGSPFIFEVDDGRAFRFEAGTGYTRVGADYELTDLDQASELVDSLRQGDSLYITFVNPQLRETGLGFSLAGVTASLLWMSEQVGMPATEIATELVVEAETGVPELVEKLHNSDGICAADGLPVFPPEAYSLNEDQILYILSCTRGAYNFGSRLYLFDRRYDEVRILHFATYSESGGWGGTDLLFNVHFDLESKTLHSFYKGRGLGDCGGAATLEWGDYMFKLLEYRSWEACDGTHMPDDWPVIFQMK